MKQKAKIQVNIGQIDTQAGEVCSFWGAYMQRFFTLIALTAVIVSTAVFVFVREAKPASALGLPLGGRLIVPVPPTPLCPVAHFTIINIATPTPTLIGLTIVPGSRVFMRYNVVTPRVSLLGTYVPAPIPCAVPYPIFPVEMLGTSLIP